MYLYSLFTSRSTICSYSKRVWWSYGHTCLLSCFFA